MNKEKMVEAAPAVLRIGISLVILWFGVQQLTDVASWIGYLPPWTQSLPISQQNLIYMNGAFEVIFGLFMLAGFYTRFAAFFIALHMLEITHAVGYDATGVRDFGLFIACLSIFLRGADKYTVDRMYDKY